MSLWDWAVQAYGRPGVADACLDLQDRHGQSVPLLLWAAWGALHGRRLGDTTLAAGADLARAWEEIAVGPLRQVRRQLAAPIGGLAAQDLREQVKAAELSAERALIQALEAMAPIEDGAARPLEPALREAAAAWGAVPPSGSLHDLAVKLA